MKIIKSLSSGYISSILIILLLFTIEMISISNVIGQTQKLEEANLHEMVTSGKLITTEYSSYGKKWNNLLEEMGGYPELPYNENTNTIEFSQVFEFPGIDKKTIYNRILEWSALTFGSLNAVLHYENFETGKIILKGMFEITYRLETKSFWGFEKESISRSECTETYIFTIKDNKLKIEIANLMYEYTVGGMSLAGTYYPESKTIRSIHSLYPITKDDPVTWKGKLNLLVETSDKINSLLTSLYLHLENYADDYDF